jgi:hypothetical protein
MNNLNSYVEKLEIKYLHLIFNFQISFTSLCEKEEAKILRQFHT